MILPLCHTPRTLGNIQLSHPNLSQPGPGVSAEQQESWLLAGWERSKYDEAPGGSLGVIVNIDRVVVVTGVSTGIGYAITKTLVAHQCHVFGR